MSSSLCLSVGSGLSRVDTVPFILNLPSAPTLLSSSQNPSFLKALPTLVPQPFWGPRSALPHPPWHRHPTSYFSLPSFCSSFSVLFILIHPPVGKCTQLTQSVLDWEGRGCHLQGLQEKMRDARVLCLFVVFHTQLVSRIEKEAEKMGFFWGVGVALVVKKPLWGLLWWSNG